MMSGQLWEAYVLMIAVAIALISLIKRLTYKALVVALIIAAITWMTGAWLSVKICVSIWCVFIVWMAYEIEVAPVVQDEAYPEMDAVDEDVFADDIFS